MKILLLIPVVFLSACGKQATLKGVKATPLRVETTITTTTTGTVDAQQKAVLTFGAVGRIEKVLVQAGSVVKKGQLLAKLENRDVQSVFENASKELNRANELFKDNLVSRANLDDAERAFQVARANLDKTEIRAPFDGVITEANLQIGELSQAQPTPDKPPLRLVDQKPRVIKGDIDEVDLAKVKVGTPARVKVPAARPSPFPATIERVVAYVSTSKEQERTARIELKLSEPDQLIPVGASAEIEVVIATKDNVLAVPTRALLGPAGQRYVYRFADDKIYRTPVTVGIGNYDRTEVATGLSAGDVIAIPGDFELKDGMKAKVEMQPWPQNP